MSGEYKGKRHHHPGRLRGDRRPQRRARSTTRSCTTSRTRPAPAPAPAAASSPPTRWRRRSRCSACRRWASATCRPWTRARKRSRSRRAGWSWTCCARACRRGRSSRKKSLDNAIAGVMATGGSTNAVLHLLAVAARGRRQARPSTSSTASSRKTPLLADMKPWGNYTAPEMHDAGGMAVVAKRLLEAGLLQRERDDGHRRTIGEEARRGAARRRARRWSAPLDDPIKPSGGIVDPARQPRARGLRGQGVRPERKTCTAAPRASSTARRTPSPR